MKGRFGLKVKNIEFLEDIGHVGKWDMRQLTVTKREFQCAIGRVEYLFDLYR